MLVIYADFQREFAKLVEKLTFHCRLLLLNVGKQVY